jgi:hypothetical protein
VEEELVVLVGLELLELLIQAVEAVEVVRYQLLSTQVVLVGLALWLSQYLLQTIQVSIQELRLSQL